MRHLGIAAALTVLAGCGGGEEIRRYRVVVDPTPLSKLPNSCYCGGTPPTPRVEERNLYRDFIWTVWEAGSSDRAFLELDSPEGGWRLGDAPPVQLSGAIAGSGDTFPAERLLVAADGKELESTALRIIFEDVDTLSRGVMDLKSKCATCAGGGELSSRPGCRSPPGRKYSRSEAPGHAPRYPPPCLWSSKVSSSSGPRSSPWAAR